MEDEDDEGDEDVDEDGDAEMEPQTASVPTAGSTSDRTLRPRV